jgi:DNA-binding MarR family transcriptional regulator
LSNESMEGNGVGDAVLTQAAQLEQLLPVVMRQLFTADPAHPVTDLPFGQFRLCVLLHQRGRRTMSQLGDDLGISVSAVTQMADRLERAGLVERVAEATGDRRTRYLQLTPQGEQLMESRMAQRLERAEEALRLLAPDERLVVLNALEVLREVSRKLSKMSRAQDLPPAASETDLAASGV